MPEFDGEKILKLVFDPTQVSLRTIDAGAASGTLGTELDWREVLKRIYDSATNKIRTVTIP